MRLEDLLREVLADVAEEAPAPDRPAGGRVAGGRVAGGGVAGGRVVPGPDRAAVAVARVRRRRVALTAAAAAVLGLAGAVAGPALVGGGPAPAPVATAGSVEPLPPTPVDSALRPAGPALSGAYQLTSYGTERGAAVRRPGTTGFRELPWRQVAVSPTGRVAVIDSPNREPGTRLGVIDGGRVRWLDLGGGAIHPAWSPDGRTVLVTTVTGSSPVGQRDGFALVDTTAWTVRRVDGPIGPGVPALGVAGLDWDTTGTAVVGAVDVTTYGDEKPAYGLGRWDLTGYPLHTVRLPGRPGTLLTHVVSPWDGRIAASDGGGVAVVDGRDGRVLARPSTTATAVYGWRDRSHLVVEVAGGLALLGLDGRTTPYATGTVVGRATLTRTG